VSVGEASAAAPDAGVEIRRAEHLPPQPARADLRHPVPVRPPPDLQPLRARDETPAVRRYL